MADKKANSLTNRQIHSEKVQWLPLSDLLLDSTNPRLGKQLSLNAVQKELLDTIVDDFGVDDVISSIAVNGYFDAEPLVGVRDKKTSKILIKEGNRRLAACLILAGDPREKNQSKRISDSQELQNQYGNSPIKSIPILIYDNQKELLPYLGVRHIAASQPWDSYAKAAWVADVLDKRNLTLEDVSKMIGDQYRTVPRILEGYYLINQLIEKGRFTPEQSMRPGRGSNPKYPISWVYTALGYKSIRNWLSLADLTEGLNKEPLRSSKLDAAGELMIFLFGHKQKKISAAISDSREITELAKAIADQDRRQLLKRGKTVFEIASLSKPSRERISDGLYDALEALRPILVLLTESPIKSDEAIELVKPSKRVKQLAYQVYKGIQAALNEMGTEEDDDTQ